MHDIRRQHNKRHALRRLPQPLGAPIRRRQKGEPAVGLVVLVHDAEEFLARREPLGLAAAHAHVAGQVHADARVEGAEPDDVDVGDGAEDSVEVVDAWGVVSEWLGDRSRVWGWGCYLRGFRFGS